MDNRYDKTIGQLCEGLRADAFLLWKTLSATPRPYNRWKAETLSFLHVLLVWGVKLTSLLNKRRQSWTIHSKQTVDRIRGLAHKEICTGANFMDQRRGQLQTSSEHAPPPSGKVPYYVIS